jgi:SAM-dependent methyltransferase
MFAALRRHCGGLVLDVGGWDFFEIARRRGVAFEHWTTLEHNPDHVPKITDPRLTVVHGDGCEMDFEDERFDTVLSVQVLEHVFEPIRMVKEIGRVLKSGGRAIFVMPATSTMHSAPNYHYNFSRYWIREVMEQVGLDIIEFQPLGGVWSSMASHLVFFFFQSVRYPGMSDPEITRGLLYYILWPFMALFALAAIPLCMFFSLGDLAEEPNNHLVVVRRR